MAVAAKGLEIGEYVSAAAFLRDDVIDVSCCASAFFTGETVAL